MGIQSMGRGGGIKGFNASCIIIMMSGDMACTIINKSGMSSQVQITLMFHFIIGWAASMLSNIWLIKEQMSMPKTHIPELHWMLLVCKFEHELNYSVCS